MKKLVKAFIVLTVLTILLMGTVSAATMCSLCQSTDIDENFVSIILREKS